MKDIWRATRKLHSSEEKIRIVLSGQCGEDSIAELCRKEGIAQSLYYGGSKEFLGEARAATGSRRAERQKRLARDMARQVNSGEVKGLHGEALALKELVADLSSKAVCSKKNMTGDATNAIGPREWPNGGDQEQHIQLPRSLKSSSSSNSRTCRFGAP